MKDSKNIGRYVGPVVILLLVTEIINFHIWSTAGNPQVVYLNGFILVLFGFYIIHAHNVWKRSWPVIITLTGWFFALLGLYRMFFPEAKQAPENIFMTVGLLILVLLEVFMTFKAYSSKD